MLRMAILLMLVSAAMAQQSNDALLQRAVGLHQSGDIDGAIAAYREYLKAQPESVQARSNLGAAMARAGRFEEAITEYGLALQGAPRNPAILVNLALAYYKSGRVSEAVPRFEEASALAPEYRGQIALLLGSCYNRMGEYGKAVALLEPLDGARSDDPAFNYLYGSALAGAGQNEKGQVVLERILSKGDSAEARLLQGTLKMQANDRDGAMSDFERAIALNSKLPGAHSRKAEILMGVGEIGRAAEEFKKELEIDPTDFLANLNLGVLAKQEQDYPTARVHLDRALKARPGDPGVRYQMALLDLATGQLDASRGALESLIAATPDFAEVHATLATVHYRAGRKEDGDRERALAQKLAAEQEQALRNGMPRGVTRK